jgi:hypothetical protein
VAPRNLSEGGSRTVATGDAVSTSPDNAQLGEALAIRERSEPTPCVLHMRVTSGIATGPFPRETQRMAGSSQLYRTTWDYAFLILRWGDLLAATEQTVVCDLRSGTYQLPPCTFAHVYACTWNSTGLATLGHTVACAFSDGITPHAMRPTYTIEGVLQTATAGAALNLTNAVGSSNAHARWFDCWAEGWNGGLNGVGAADAPILCVEGQSSKAGVPALERNYLTGVFCPAWGPVEIANLASTGLRIRNAGSADVNVCARFWLELG